MAEKLGRGLVGSLRRRVAHEIHLHFKENEVLRNSQYSLFSRVLRGLLGDRRFIDFLTLYLAFVLVFAFLEAILPTAWLLGWPNEIKAFLKDYAGFLITAQVGILGVVSIAVGLVTLIAQRDDGSSTSTDIRLYYSETLAYEVVASSTALLVVLAFQIYWPLQFGLHKLGLGSSNLLFKVALTAIHIFWLATNVAAFAQFLATSLRFVEPRAREEMRERYTANIVIPRDLDVWLFHALLGMAPANIIPTANKDGGPQISFGMGVWVTGRAEVARKFSRPAQLNDVRLTPISWMLRGWWRRSDKPESPDRGRRRSILDRNLPPEIGFPISPGSTLKGEQTICRRDGGETLSWCERQLVRLSFGFRPARPETEVAPPSPSDFLEELADKIVTQIDRLAETGFREAFDEMTRYHTFLLKAYSSTDTEGKPQNFAAIREFFSSPLEDWTRHYRRIFDRAADKISIAPYFMERLAYAPSRLLRGLPPEVAKPVETNILDLSLYMVFVLEAWLTRKSTTESPGDEGGQPRFRVAGSDRKAYDEVLDRFTGAWETLLDFGEVRIAPLQRAEGPPETMWNIRRSRWPFLNQHLFHSARFLAHAVWNEDESGSERFRDNLLRWLDRSEGTLDYDRVLRPGVLLTPELFELDWPLVLRRLEPFRERAPYYRASPNPVATSIIRRAFDDVIVITTAIMLQWYIRNQQATDIGGLSARRLWNGEVNADDGTRHIGEGPRNRFALALGTIVRAELAGGYPEGSYRSVLDGFASLLDTMTERRTIPGRVYSSWGSRDFSALRIPLLAMLLVSLPENPANETPAPDENLIQRIGEWTDREGYFKDGDESLRRISSELKTSAEYLEKPAELALVHRGALMLMPECDLAASSDRLRQILGALEQRIETRRLERLRERDIDPVKLQGFQDAMEGVLTGIASAIVPFTDYQVVRAPANDTEPYIVPMGVDKAQLITPALTWEQTELPAIYSGSFQEAVLFQLWLSFVSLPREIVTLHPADYPEVYWRAVLEKAPLAGEKPILLLPYGRIVQDLSEWQWLRGEGEKPSFLEITHAENLRNSGAVAYHASVNGIDVYTIHQPRLAENQSILFSAKALGQITHHCIEDGHVAQVTFTAGPDPKQSELRVAYNQEISWRETPLFEFVMDMSTLDDQQPDETDSVIIEDELTPSEEIPIQEKGEAPPSDDGDRPEHPEPPE
jgi:hypothetical protein